MAWRAVVGWEGLYEVSDRGQVRSLDRAVWEASRHGGLRLVRHKERLLALNRKDSSGRRCVSLSSKNSGTLVSRLVLIAFDRSCPVGMEACHGSMGPAVDWWPENLYWGTSAQNQGPDRVRDHTTTRGEHSGMAKLAWVDVCEIRRLLTETKLLQREIAERFGIERSTISRIKNKEQWRYSPEEW